MPEETVERTTTTTELVSFVEDLLKTSRALAIAEIQRFYRDNAEVASAEK